MRKWPDDPDARDLAEAKAVLGREVVVEALRDQARAADLYLTRIVEVRGAINEIRARVKDVAAARAFAAGLPREVKVAIAGAWVGFAFDLAIVKLGLHEVQE